MKLFSCKVRLSGSLYNEVPKHGVTTAEVLLFKQIHGEDAVVDIVETGSDKRTQADERDRLASEYGPALVTAKVGQTPLQAITNVFGLNRLPDGIDGASKAKPVAKKADEPEEPEPPAGEDDPEE